MLRRSRLPREVSGFRGQAEGAADGVVCGEAETVTELSILLDRIRSKARPASELTAVIGKAASRMNAMDWRKPGYSSSNGGERAETAASGGMILVRDTANRAGGTLAFAAAAWTAFVTLLR